MMTSTIYGIISDIHSRYDIVEPAVSRLVSCGAQKLILNGDNWESLPSIPASQNYLAKILQAAADSGKETFVQPGSHERLSGYLPVVRDFCKRYSNIVNVFDLDKLVVEADNHDLLFIPGSDTTSGGEFRFGCEMPSGHYLIVPEAATGQRQDKGVVNMRACRAPGGKIEDTMLNVMHPGQVEALSYFNLGDLEGKVRDGELTVAICHVPLKTNNPRGGVDVAYFGVAGDVIYPGVQVEDKIVGAFFERWRRRPNPHEIIMIAADNGITLKMDNVGNELLRDFYADCGIRKSVCGHIHESGHRAHRSDGVHVRQDEWAVDMHWNAGCLEWGQCGLLEVDGARVRYRNIIL